MPPYPYILRVWKAITRVPNLVLVTQSAQSHPQLSWIHWTTNNCLISVMFGLFLPIYKELTFKIQLIPSLQFPFNLYTADPRSAHVEYTTTLSNIDCAFLCVCKITMEMCTCSWALSTRTTSRPGSWGLNTAPTVWELEVVWPLLPSPLTLYI